jgi:hypothetical protein
MLVREDAEINAEFTIDPDHPSSEDKQKYLIFKVELNAMNEAIRGIGKNEEWNMNERNTDKICNHDAIDPNYSGHVVFYPKTCKPTDRDWISQRSDPDIIKNEAQIITDTLSFIENANSNTDNQGYLKF